MTEYKDIKNLDSITLTLADGNVYDIALELNLSGDILYIINRPLKKIMGRYCMPSGPNALSAMHDPDYTPGELMRAINELQKDVVVFKQSMYSTDTTIMPVIKTFFSKKISRKTRKDKRKRSLS